MKDLKELRRIADASLAGLTAGAEMKQRIVAEAAAPRKQARRWLPAVAVAAVCALVLALAIPGVRGGTGPIIISQPAGSGSVGAERADLGNGNIQVQMNGVVPGYKSIWAGTGSGAFPLVRVDGRWYRLLTNQDAVKHSALGQNLGSVQEYTTEPALSSSDCILSNNLPVGTAVYAVKDMGGTLVAAEVNGSIRVYQRVSFNGDSVQRREGLKDTLQLSGHITAMALSDVGVVTDGAALTKLYTILVNLLSFESDGSVSGKQSLLIALDNGATVQLAVKGSRLGACGVWVCPEFFDAFADAVK